MKKIKIAIACGIILVSLGGCGAVVTSIRDPNAVTSLQEKVTTIGEVKQLFGEPDSQVAGTRWTVLTYITTIKKPMTTESTVVSLLSGRVEFEDIVLKLTFDQNGILKTKVISHTTSWR
jgi:hypothetical protein